MLRRRICLFVMMLLAMIVVAPKEVYAGTCTCSIGNNRLAYLVSNNCDSATEFAQCKGNTSLECNCIKKAASGLAANTCTCAGSSNCQGSTPNAVCEPRSGVCICSQYSSLGQIQQNIPVGTTTAAAASSSNPFAGCSSTSINTALGCIPVDMGEFVKWLLPFLFGIAGGISFLLMVYGFILITVSKGDPKAVQGARETITSAITGLVLSIFSIFILRLIVSGILKLPGVN